jgi:hypothetical protein
MFLIISADLLYPNGTFYPTGKGDMWTDSDGIGGTFAGLAGDSEMYAYVSFAINMDSSS